MISRSHTAILMALCLSIAAYADVPDPDPARFQDAIDEFVLWDSKNAVPDDAILFVGSSSIRLWPTAKAFPGEPVVNRGFGGAELSDVIHYYDRVIRPYDPDKIFLYAGDNDVATGKPADQVFGDYIELVGMIRTDFPDAELVFISIKPSTARWHLWSVMVEANRLVREYAETHPNLGYADLATPLLDDEGQPGDVFVEDGLHLNEWGYRLWQEVLAPYLR